MFDIENVFLSAAASLDIDPDTATRECRAYIGLLRDRDMFRLAMQARQFETRGRVDADEAYQKARTALEVVEQRIADIERVFEIQPA